MSQPPGEHDTLTYQEAAIFLGVVPQQIKNLVSQGYFHPIKIKGERKKRVAREELERFLAARPISRAERARQYAQESASLLVEALLWGVSDEGEGGAQMRKRVVAQVSRLRMSKPGREALAGIRDGLESVLESEPIKSAESARLERERFRQLLDMITDALAAPTPRRTSRSRGASEDASTATAAAK